MNRLRALVVVPVVWLAVLATTCAWAAEDILSVVPEGALGFAVVNRPADTDAKIQALGQQMQLPVPPLLATFKAKTGVQKGLDEKGSSAIVVMPGKDADSVPIVLWFAAVTDFREFLEQLKPDDPRARIVKVQMMDAPFLVGNKGGYAILVEPKHRDTLKEVLDSPSHVSDDLAAWRGWLAENDMAGVVTRRGIELFCNKAQEGLKQVRESFAQFPDEMKEDMQAAIAVFEIYEKIPKLAGEEVQIYAAGVRVDEQGNVHLSERARFTPGGQVAKIVSEVKPPEGELLAGLPGGPFVFAGAGALPKSLGDAMTEFSIDIMKAMPNLYGITEEQAEQLAKVSTEYMQGLEGMSMLMGVGKPGGSLYDGMVVVMKVDDAKKFMAQYQESFAKIVELAKDAEGSIFSGMDVKQVEINGITALEITTQAPKTAAMKNVPNYDKMMEALFGPGGKLLAYLAPADEHTIVATYTSKDALLKCLKLVKDADGGLAGDPDVAQTAALLPAGAQWIGYWSPKGTIELANRLIPAMAPNPEDVFKLPEFSETPPIGLAAKAAEGELMSHMAVPAPVVKAIGQYVVEVKKMIARQMIERQVEKQTEAVEQAKKSSSKP